MVRKIQVYEFEVIDLQPLYIYDPTWRSVTINGLENEDE